MCIRDSPYISLSPDSQDRLNIFDVDLVDEDGVMRADIDDAIKAVQAVVFRMIRVYDESVLTGQVKVMILEKIKELYKCFGITEDPQSLYENPTNTDIINVSGIRKKMPQLSDLVNLMRQEPTLEAVSYTHLDVYKRQAMAVFIGYLSHLVLDSFNPAGVPWLWPLKFRLKIPVTQPGGIIAVSYTHLR